MNQTLENLKKRNDDEFKDYSDLHYFEKYFCIPILEDFEKRIKELELKSGYILTDEELAREKIGGTD